MGLTLTTAPDGTGVASKNTKLRSTLRQETAREIRMNLRRDIRRELTAKLRIVKGEQLNKLLVCNFERGNRHWKCSVLWIDMRGLLRQVNMAVKSIVMTTTTFDAQRQRLALLQSLAQCEMAQGWQPLVVKFQDFLGALAGAKACKQPGSDDVVAEMVRALSWPTLLWLYLLFLVRLGGWETESADSHPQEV